MRQDAKDIGEARTGAGSREQAGRQASARLRDGPGASAVQAPPDEMPLDHRPLENRPVDEISAARATQYLLLATLFARAPNAALLRDLAKLQGGVSPLGLAQIALADAARDAEASDIATEYLNLFIGVGRGELLPYCSFYLTGFLHERPLARVREDMARLGLERQGGVFEPEDHISSLFEIMAGLTGGSFDAPGKAADNFFERHIEPWAPRLMADVAAAPSARFYKHVARLGAVWIEIEQDVVRLPE